MVRLFNNYGIGESRVFKTYDFETFDPESGTVSKNDREWLDGINSVEHRVGIFDWEGGIVFRPLNAITIVSSEEKLKEIFYI